jgi:hypothetical protein
MRMTASWFDPHRSTEYKAVARLPRPLAISASDLFFTPRRDLTL